MYSCLGAGEMRVEADSKRMGRGQEQRFSEHLYLMGGSLRALGDALNCCA